MTPGREGVASSNKHFPVAFARPCFFIAQPGGCGSGSGSPWDSVPPLSGETRSQGLAGPHEARFGGVAGAGSGGTERIALRRGRSGKALWSSTFQGMEAGPHIGPRDFPPLAPEPSLDSASRGEQVTAED